MHIHMGESPIFFFHPFSFPASMTSLFVVFAIGQCEIRTMLGSFVLCFDFIFMKKRFSVMKNSKGSLPFALYSSWKSQYLALQTMRNGLSTEH